MRARGRGELTPPRAGGERGGATIPLKVLGAPRRLGSLLMPVRCLHLLWEEVSGTGSLGALPRPCLRSC